MCQRRRCFMRLRQSKASTGRFMKMNISSKSFSWPTFSLSYEVNQAQHLLHKQGKKVFRYYRALKPNLHTLFLIQDGVVNCQKQKCKALSCKYKIYDKDSCCPRCAVNRAEVCIFLFKTTYTKGGYLS